MKRLVIASLFIIVLPVCAMRSDEKAVVSALVVLWSSCFIYDTFLKDPAIKLREQEERAKANVRVGEIALYSGDNSTESYGKKLYDYLFNNGTVKNKK